jgi:hypothetical protein
MKRTTLRLAVIALMAAGHSGSLFAGRSADFLILGAPGNLTIFNQFEQPLTESERGLLKPGTPVQIIETNTTLGDQITPALRGRFNGASVFILKDDAGNFIGDKAKKNRQVFKGCALVDDTVEAAMAISLFDTYPLSGSACRIAKGEPLVRMFRYNQSYYAASPATATKRGWCPVSSVSAWRTIARVAAPQQILTPAIRTMLDNRISAANEQYRRTFDHFNRAANQQKSAPLWQSIANSAAPGWRLSAPYDRSRSLDNSTRYLIRELETVLLGKPYSVVLHEGEISIQPREEVAE